MAHREAVGGQPSRFRSRDGCARVWHEPSMVFAGVVAQKAAKTKLRANHRPAGRSADKAFLSEWRVCYYPVKEIRTVIAA